MTTTIDTYRQIHESQINNSPSKQMFSFSKAPRFSTLKPSSSCGAFSYNIPSSFSRRGASMGLGERFDFAAAAKGKSPRFYNLRSCFEQKKHVFNNCTFGTGREAFSKIDKNIPGPAKYNIDKPFGYFAPKCSFGRGKHSFLNIKQGPGPGEYNEKAQINPKGKFPSSKMQNLRNVFFGVGERFVYKHDLENSPGPGTYNQKSLMGNNFNSKFTSNAPVTFKGRNKILNSTENYPGPGAYKVFSEFGSHNYYEKKYNNLNMSQIKSSNNDKSMEVSVKNKSCISAPDADQFGQEE